MGSGHTKFQEVRFPQVKPPMFAMSLTGASTSNKATMLLTYCPPEALSTIQNTIGDYWPYGIKKEEEINASCYKIKFKDFPFEWVLYEDGLKSKTMMGQIVLELGRLGWLPLIGCDLQSDEDVSTILFYRGCSPIFTAFKVKITTLNVCRNSQTTLELISRHVRILFSRIVRP